MSDQANPIDDLRQRLAGVAQSPAYVRLSREVKEAVAKRIAWARKHARRGLSHRPYQRLRQRRQGVAQRIHEARAWLAIKGMGT